jgi:hypothetical protein
MGYHNFIAKLSHRSLALLERLFDFFHAVLSGFWLGVMSEKSLDYSDELHYNSANRYIGDKYNTSGLFDFEKAMIEKHFHGAKHLLLLAAGGGRETIALSGMGYVVDSYECNKKLVESGNALLERTAQNRILFLERNSVPAEIKKFDGIIIGWGAYSLIRGRNRRISFLNSLKPFLNTGAPLMISFLWEEKKSRKDLIIKSVSNFFRFFRLKEKSEPGDRLFNEFVHFFTEEEVRVELAEAKYRVIDYSSSEYGCLIARI